MNLFNKKYIPYYVIAGLFIYIFMIGGKEEVEVVIPSKSNSVDISNPKPEARVDTVYIDTTDQKKGFRLVQVENPVNKVLKEAYEKAVKDNDSLKQASLYYEAIKERRYTEQLEDSLQVITVTSEVIGTLSSQSISYKTKEQRLKVETKRTKPVVYFGSFASLPNIDGLTPSFGVQVQIANKKRVLTGGIDNKKTIHVGYAIKLF